MLHSRTLGLLVAVAVVCLSGWGCSSGETPKADAGGTQPADANGSSDVLTSPDTSAPADTSGPEVAVASDGRADDGASASDGAREAGGVDATEAGVVLSAACPPAPTPCKVMPYGDSITDGFQSSAPGGGYRVPLFRKALMASQHLTFVGSAQNGPTSVDGTPFPRQHEGHSGYTIDTSAGHTGISMLAMGSLQTYKPHVVLLMIGTNDLGATDLVAGAPMRLGKLLDTIYQYAPDVTVILAQLTPQGSDGANQRVMAYNGAMPALVSARQAAGKHIILVDMYTAFTSVANYRTVLMADGLHPNDTGYAKMADVWYGALGPLLH